MAIAQRNHLRAMLADKPDKAAALQLEAARARERGQDDVARHLLEVKDEYDRAIAPLQKQLQEAEAAAGAVKESIRQAETRVRQEAAERLARGGWKRARIQEELNRALASISFTGHHDAFDRAARRIRELQSRSAARLEMAQEGLMETPGEPWTPPGPEEDDGGVRCA